MSYLENIQKNQPEPGKVYSLSTLGRSGKWEPLAFTLPALGDRLTASWGQGCGGSDAVCVGFRKIGDTRRAVVIDSQETRHHVDRLRLDSDLSPIGWRLTGKPRASESEIAELLDKSLKRELLRAEDKATKETTDKENRAKGALIAAQFFGPEVKGLIVAEYKKDKSDTQTDYFATSTAHTIVLATSKHTRSLFPEMRKAARRHKATARLASPESVEHRENYSMGAGTYLSGSDRIYCDGWIIKKYIYNFRTDCSILESLAIEHALTA